MADDSDDLSTARDPKRTRGRETSYRLLFTAYLFLSDNHL